MFKAHGHDVRRMHTDGEAVFHSDEVYDAIKSEMDGIGCLVTTGADYFMTIGRIVKLSATFVGLVMMHDPDSYNAGWMTDSTRALSSMRPPNTRSCR